ncbi:metallophosphoesterase family protein [Phytoactinopolyspora halotolerans]|uniref:Metallophosphoesterase n=1 Tax=Phytoactinopolyspora halotolerans TaxID=1981512 RepID=A0A6L9SGQ1_9ACTN|nr:metallophosphoesterase family protein [Phytoactinopolyspora halotolerans]NEE03280.1 metallophosphoesterase [Phytoactinopolyspora halotolerans]
MSATWYTADLHFGHANIITYSDRPWDTPEEMDAGLVERWNSRVADDDTVWVLGDVSLTPKKLGPVASLNGTKILVAGNHDACWTGNRRSERARRAVSEYLDAGFAAVHESGVVRHHSVGDHDVDLSHLPYVGDHTESDRYADRRPSDEGRPLICGHVHDAWRVHGRQINVGVDVWDYAPVSAQVLAEELAKLPSTSR